MPSELSENEVNTEFMVNDDFEPRDDEEAVLAVLAEEYRANPLLIRERTGLDKGTINTALTRLTSAGWVRKVTRGLYEFVDDPRESAHAGREPAPSPSEVPADTDDPDAHERPEEPPEDGPKARAHESDASPEPPVEALIDQLADEVLPGSGEKLEARREALHAVVDYLRENGTATPKEFQNEVYPDHPAHYTGGSNPPYSWWTNAMYEGMSALAARTDKIGAADSSGEWTWHGDD